MTAALMASRWHNAASTLLRASTQNTIWQRRVALSAGAWRGRHHVNAYQAISAARGAWRRNGNVGVSAKRGKINRAASDVCR